MLYAVKKVALELAPGRIVLSGRLLSPGFFDCFGPLCGQNPGTKANAIAPLRTIPPLR
jgi:hypothetical protein